MQVETVTVWFRRDLRLYDNFAWTKAVETGNTVVPVFIYCDEDSAGCTGAASKWWLHHALEDLSSQLDSLGTPLILLNGDTIGCFKELVDQIHPQQVFWNRCYEPLLIEEERKLESFLESKGIRTESGNSVLLVEPDKVLNKQRQPYKVYTAFARAWANEVVNAPVRMKRPKPTEKKLSGGALRDLNLISEGSSHGFQEGIHNPTRKGAETALRKFLDSSMPSYAKSRDFPAVDGTSCLSAALHWGQIGPREIIEKVMQQPDSVGRNKFVSELAWREFAYYILFHFPYTVEGPFRTEFKDFPWHSDGPGLQSWKEGKTGYPLVDAGMRELAQTGLIHNRVRMLVASFLVKHLLISWKTGAAWFFDKLVDADLANNTLGWQWVAGCGVDAAPYFRIFNPVTQGKKFDKNGTYIRRYVPELSKVPDIHVHEPWLMPMDLQKKTGCIIGEDYPQPVCGLMEGRIRALSAWKSFNNPDQQTLAF